MVPFGSEVVNEPNEPNEPSDPDDPKEPNKAIATTLTLLHKSTEQKNWSENHIFSSKSTLLLTDL